MFDIAAIKAQLLAEWAMIHGAPIDFAAAVIVGWLFGWLLIRAWYRREIRGRDYTIKIVEGERDIERRQKEGLRNAIKEIKPDAPVLAMEVGYGDSDVRKIVDQLAAGKKVETPVLPLHIPSFAIIPLPLTEAQIKQIAAINYTAGTGLAQIEATNPDFLTLGKTITTASINTIAKTFEKPEEKK